MGEDRADGPEGPEGPDETTDPNRPEKETLVTRFVATWLAALVLFGCATIGEDEIEPGASASAGAFEARAVPPSTGGRDVTDGWSGFRGAGRDARAHGESFPEALESLEWEELWRVRVGEGLSGPIRSGDLVICHARRDDAEIVSAHRVSDGSVVWEKSHAIADFSQPFEAWVITSGPLATPTVADGRVYTVGIHGFVQCFDLETGERHFGIGSEEIDGEISSHRFGHSASPLVHDGKVFVSFSTGARDGSRGTGHFVALDAADGSVVWRALPETVSYPSPVLAKLWGDEQIVVRSWTRVVGLDPKSGAILWEHAAEASGFTRDCATPLVVGNVVFLCNDKHGTIAVEISRDATGAFSTTRLYRTGHLGSRTASPIFHEGFLYNLHHRGRAACIDARTGKRRWVSRALGDHASFIQIDGQALALADDGHLELLDLSPEAYRLLRRWKIGEYTWSQPSFTDRNLYFRDGDDLVCTQSR